MYVPADVYAACDDVGRHLLLARAAVASQQGRVALTGASAAALHGFAAYGSCLTTVHLIRLDGGSSRSAANVQHHVSGSDLEEDVADYGGILAVSPARSVWEVACRHSLESGVVTADSALREQPALARGWTPWPTGSPAFLALVMAERLCVWRIRVPSRWVSR